jgi:hypothetical protein
MLKSSAHVDGKPMLVAPLREWLLLLLVPKLRPNRIGWFSLRLEFRSWALKQEDISRNKYIDPTRQSRKPSTVLSFLSTA